MGYQNRPPPTSIPPPGRRVLPPYDPRYADADPVVGRPYSGHRFLIIFGCLAVGLMIGIPIGGALEGERPERVKVETKEVTRWRTRTEWRILKVRVREESSKRVVYRDRVITPDGTTREREIEASETHAREVENTTAAGATEAAGESVVERRVEVERARPAWRASVLAGVEARSVRLLPPSAGPVVFGGLVERRIVGPVSAGAWGLSNATFGVALSVEF